MKIREIIATHSNTDFDAFAGMVAAHKLYPEATICLSGAVNRNVREFRTLFADEIATVDAADVDLDTVTRLVAIETYHPNRLAELAPLCGRPGVEVVVFDHHRADEAPPAFVRPNDFIVSEDGSVVTLLLHIIAERGIAVSPLEATLFALGIHEDTGSLTFPTSTVRDAEALTFCMRSGANQHLVERFLHNPLTPEQRDLLVRVLEAAKPVEAGGLDVLVAAVRGDEYIEGVSLVVHKAMDLGNSDGFVLLVEMESRVFVTARSRVGALDMAAVLKPLGGGGHAAAASAILKNVSLSSALSRLRASLQRTRADVPTAADIMSHPVHWVSSDTSVDEALVLCERHGYGGVSVQDAGVLVGSVARRDLDRAIRHRLGHAPVKAVMTSVTTVVPAGASLDELTTQLARDPLGRVPVVAGRQTGSVSVDDVVGVVTRSDVLRALHASAENLPPAVVTDASEALAKLGLDDVLSHIQAVATGYRGVYLVGGAVRDLLLGERVVDVDIAVEGDGIEFARELAVRLGGRVRPHTKFQTAVVVVPAKARKDRLRVDVASTRTEFYDFPAALPKVEHATIRGDLARRDFSINAMAVDLGPREYGRLLDYFGGLDDLARKRIVVLHNLSFIEDPTRIFRAVRYENRYGFRMDPHTLALARACGSMDLIGDLSSARQRDELVLLLDERKVGFTLRRLRELGLTTSIHPRLALDDGTSTLIAAADALRERHGLDAESPAWRLRLAILLKHLEPEEIAAWAMRMKFRRTDRQVLERAWLMGARLCERLERGIAEADLYDLAHAEPCEALVIAMATSGGPVEERLAGYLDHTRHSKLSVSGRDLIELGFRQSVDLGDVLHSLLRLKLNGVIDDREQELDAARAMLHGGRAS